MIGRFSYKIVSLCFLFLLLPACSSITEHGGPYISNEVKLPKTVAILPFVNKTTNPDANVIMQKMFYNFFSSLQYQDIEPFLIDSLLKKADLYDKIISGEDVSVQELGEILGADAIVFGEATSFGKVFAIVYNDYHAGLKLRMVECKTGNVIWENYNTAHQRDISIPTNPIGLAATVVEKIVLLNMNQMDDMKVTAMLCMKLAESVPNPAIAGELGPGIQVFVHNGSNKLLKPGESLKVVLAGEPGQTAKWDILPMVKDLPMEEKEPGIYIGEYIVKSGDNLFSGELVGYLESEEGAVSRWVDTLGPVYMGEPAPLPQRISTDLILSYEKSPYMIEETVFVLPSAKLTIEAGVIIWCKGLGMVVTGEIEAQGTTEKPIRFMNIDAMPWKGIVIDKSRGKNIFTHCEVYNAENGIRARGSLVTIENCLFQNNTVGMFFEEGNVSIKKSVVRASHEVGIHSVKSQIALSNSTISENELGGILLASTKADINHNNIYNNGKWELKLEEPYPSDFLDTTKNWWGSNSLPDIRIDGTANIEPILKEQVKIF